MNKIQFHSLEALRFFAFLKVYLLHIPIQGNFPIFSFLKSGGGIGVSFFFVLSGFLITYLLVFEKIQRGQINVSKFLLRRSLRIWPLYYLMVILAFLLPYDFMQNIGLHMVGGGYDLDWKYSFSFLENYKMLLLDNTPKTTPLPIFWSLCIEVHFYFFWIVCLWLIPIKHVLKFFIFCFLVAWVTRFFESFIFQAGRIETNDLFTNLDYFAAGGILGYLVAKDYNLVANFVQRIQNWIKWGFILCILAVVIFQKEILPYNHGTVFFIFRSSIIAILFSLLLCIFIPVDSKIKIKNSLLNYLGMRSYGLYVFHIVLIHLVFQYFITHNILIDNWSTLIVFLLSTLGGTILISSLSFKYFEKYFLSLRV